MINRLEQVTIALHSGMLLAKGEKFMILDAFSN